jgi:hypothetical protein
MCVARFLVIALVAFVSLSMGRGDASVAILNKVPVPLKESGPFCVKFFPKDDLRGGAWDIRATFENDDGDDYEGEWFTAVYPYTARGGRNSVFEQLDDNNIECAKVGDDFLVVSGYRAVNGRFHPIKTLFITVTENTPLEVGPVINRVSGSR